MLSTMVQKTSHPSKYQAALERLRWERNQTIFMRSWGFHKSLLAASVLIWDGLICWQTEGGKGEGGILLCLAVLIFASLECRALRAVLVRELEQHLIQGSLANKVTRANKSNHPTQTCVVMVFLRLRHGRIFPSSSKIDIPRKERR